MQNSRIDLSKCRGTGSCHEAHQFLCYLRNAGSNRAVVFFQARHQVPPYAYSVRAECKRFEYIRSALHTAVHKHGNTVFNRPDDLRKHHQRRDGIRKDPMMMGDNDTGNIGFSALFSVLCA